MPLPAVLLVMFAFCTQESVVAAESTQEQMSYAEQIEALRIMSTHEPENPDWHEALGHWLLGAEVEVTEEHAAEAEQHLRRAVELDSTKYWAWYDLAILHMDTEEGNRYLKNAIVANPKFPEPYYWLAYTYARNYRDPEAIPIFERYLQVARDHPDQPGSETERVELVEELLMQLRSGVDGEALLKVRRPNQPERDMSREL